MSRRDHYRQTEQVRGCSVLGVGRVLLSDETVLTGTAVKLTPLRIQQASAQDPWNAMKRTLCQTHLSCSPSHSNF